MTEHLEREEIISAIDSDDWMTRWSAIRKSGDLRMVEATAQLAACLDDADVDIQIAAEESLIKIASPEALAALALLSTKRMDNARTTVSDQNQPVDVRLSALRTLCDSNPDDLPYILEKCIHATDQKLQRKAMKYFVDAAKAEHIPVLLSHFFAACLDTHNAEIKDFSLQALKRFRSQISPTMLLPYLRDQRLQKECIASLGDLIGKLENSADNEELFEMIVEYMKRDQENRKLVGMRGVSDSFISLGRCLEFIDVRKSAAILENLRSLTAVKRPICERCGKPLRMEDRDQTKILIGIPSAYLGTVCMRCNRVECYQCRGGIGLPCSRCGGEVDGAFVHHFR